MFLQVPLLIPSFQEKKLYYQGKLYTKIDDQKY